MSNGNNGWDKIWKSVIAIVLIGTLVGSGVFVLWVNLLLVAVLIVGLVYIWTH